MPTSRRLLLVLTVLAALLAVPVGASAYAPGSDDFVNCVREGNRGVDCLAGRFDRGSNVRVFAQINPVLLDTTMTADANGEVGFFFFVPDAITDGSVSVSLTGMKNGVPVTLDVGEVVAVSDGEILPATGASSGGLIAAALAALLLGGGILVVSRRRSSTGS